MKNVRSVEPEIVDDQRSMKNVRASEHKQKPPDDDQQSIDSQYHMVSDIFDF